MNYSKKNFLNKKKIKLLIIVRLSSKRLKKKALLKINNLTLIEILILRLSKFFDPKNIIICTARNQNNEALKRISNSCKVNFFAGAEKNIFKRVIDCQRKFKFKHFVRITGDNPLTDPKSIIVLCHKHIKNRNDFTFTKSLAAGMRPEVISFQALKKAQNLAVDKNSSEYLTYFFVRASFKFEEINLRKYFANENLSSITIDTLEDFKRLKNLLKRNIFLSRKIIIQKLEKNMKKKSLRKIIPIITKKYDVRFKNSDQTILL
tara:strand:- start:43030 stop:43815 length:786 start_codon:yes stop_codon:yes gene_type:complete